MYGAIQQIYFRAAGSTDMKKFHFKCFIAVTSHSKFQVRSGMYSRIIEFFDSPTIN